MADHGQAVPEEEDTDLEEAVLEEDTDHGQVEDTGHGLEEDIDQVVGTVHNRQVVDTDRSHQAVGVDTDHNHQAAVEDSQDRHQADNCRDEADSQQHQGTEPAVVVGTGPEEVGTAGEEDNHHTVEEEAAVDVAGHQQKCQSMPIDCAHVLRLAEQVLWD